MILKVVIQVMEEDEWKDTYASKEGKEVTRIRVRDKQDLATVLVTTDGNGNDVVCRVFDALLRMMRAEK